MLLSLLLLPLLAAASPLPSNPALLACLAASSLTPITSSSTSYDNSTSPFNTRVHPFPLAVVYPKSNRQVAAAVVCASAERVPVSARSGGHSYASLGLGGISGALVVDLAAFTKISVFGDGTAAVGAGNKLGRIALKLAGKGRALPHSVSPHVGIGGQTAHGGFGLASRAWGLTLDRVSAMDVVLANGTIVKNLTASSHPDLFWALRGAAPSFAIVTYYTLRTSPLPKLLTTFSYSYPSFELTSPICGDILSAVQSFGQTAPSKLSLSMIVSSFGGVAVSGTYIGGKAAMAKTIKSLVAELPEDPDILVSEGGWLDSLGGAAAWNVSGMGRPDNFFAKSLLTPSDQLLSNDSMVDFFEYLFTTPTTTNWFVKIDLFGGAHSAINAVPLSATSFAHRDKLLIFQMYANARNLEDDFPAAGIRFVNGMHAAIVNPMREIWDSNTLEGAYVNYADPTLLPFEVRDLYWGSQYERLSQLKGLWDPENVFSNPQSIVAA